MAQMSYEEFSRKSNEQIKSNTNSNKSFGPSYFSLKDDGDTAIVRFNVADIRDVVVHSQHTLKIEDKWRKIECLRTINEPIDKCPLCRAGNKQQFRIYLEMLVYEMVDNNVVCKPVIWETAAKFRESLKSFAIDYGDLRNIIFKLTRIGRKGDTKTTYTLIPANKQIYRDDEYVPDFSAFDSFDLHKYMLLNKTERDMNYLLANGNFPIEEGKKSEVKNSNASLNTQSDSPRNNLRTYSFNRESDKTLETAPNKSNEQGSEISTASPRRYTY